VLAACRAQRSRFLSKLGYLLYRADTVFRIKHFGSRCRRTIERNDRAQRRMDGSDAVGIARATVAVIGHVAARVGTRDREVYKRQSERKTAKCRCSSMRWERFSCHESRSYSKAGRPEPFEPTLQAGCINAPPHHPR
jgi:hypothetical protein